MTKLESVTHTAPADRAPFGEGGKVAFLGPEGTFSQMATLDVFGKGVAMIETSTIEGVFEKVVRGEARFGVVPIENSSQGQVTQTLDALLKFNVKILGETVLRVRQCLLGSSLEEIETVYSHPVALAQCQNWLSTNLPSVRCVPETSTAAAAKRAAEEPRSAAIGSALAAKIFGVPILRNGIEDRSDNSTRFIIFTQNTSSPHSKEGLL